MKVNVTPGKYVIAVSGGVDSVVLLHILAKEADLELVVAHFNHGIRESSARDEEFVEALADKLNLKYESARGVLGPDASEDKARQARYKFLNDAKQKHEAASVITAHHQDDLIETAAINIMRGTGPRGLVAILANQEITRPLLDTPKKDILDFAQKHKIAWVEDESNKDPRYLRNVVRQTLNKNLTQEHRQRILKYIKDLQASEGEKEELVIGLESHIFEDAQTIKRNAFIFLPSEVANEIILHWLRQNYVVADRRLVNRLSVAVKTGRANSIHSVDKGHTLRLSAQKAYLMAIG